MRTGESLRPVTTRRSWCVPGLLTGLLMGLVVADVHRAWADVRPAAVFGDHMVLQRQKPVLIWGRAEVGEVVTVKLAGRKAQATAEADGLWRVELPALDAGGPHTLTIRGKNTLKFKDVLIGEVWLCSGQSNMEWPVLRTVDAKREIATARDRKIRHLKIPHRAAGAPVEDVEAAWEVCSPATVGRFTGCGYYMARALREALRVPIGLINASWGGTRIEPWIPPEGLATVPALADVAKQVQAAAGSKPRNHQQPVVLYNGMVHAFVGFPLRGAIWYQGESNHRDGSLYTEKKKALIGGWRALWNQGDFPFYFVQIAPFGYGREDPGILPTFWEAQAAVLDVVPNTGMVVTSDIATLNDIHPPNKQDVGKRLALLALRRTYGKDVVDSGPTLRTFEADGATLRVAFENADGGLRTRDKKPLSHFEIAGASTGFVPADARIDGDTVVLSAKGVPRPLAMRFAWHKLAQPNLVNAAGLPACAFRAGEIPRPDFLPRIEEAAAYSLVCDLDLAQLGPAPRYDVDERKQIKRRFDRIAYLLELQPARGAASYVWVSMDAFTKDAALIAVPTPASGAHFQQSVKNLRVVTNAEGLTAGEGLEGHIEFWPNNYGPANGAQVRHASGKIWDFGDDPGQPVDGYGCMQVHNPAARQTLFAVNHWKAGGGADIGLGNSDLDARSTDWTFAANGAGYSHKRLRILVRFR